MQSDEPFHVIPTVPGSGSTSTGPPGSQRAGVFGDGRPPTTRGGAELPPFADAAAIEYSQPAGSYDAPGVAPVGAAGAGFKAPGVASPRGAGGFGAPSMAAANLPGQDQLGAPSAGTRDMPGFGMPSSKPPVAGGSISAPGAAALGAGAAAVGAGTMAAANIGGPGASTGDSKLSAGGASMGVGASPGSAALSPSGPVSAVSGNVVSSGTSGGLGGPGSPHLAAAPMSLEAGALRYDNATSGGTQGSMAGVDAAAFGSIEGPPVGMQSSGEAGMTDAPSFRVIGNGPEGAAGLPAGLPPAAGAVADGGADVGPTMRTGAREVPDLSPDAPEAPAKQLSDFDIGAAQGPGSGSGSGSGSASGTAAAGLAAGAGLGVAAVAAGAATATSGRDGGSSGAAAVTGGTGGTRGASEGASGPPGVSVDSAGFGVSGATGASSSTTATVPTSHLTRALDAAARSTRPFLDRYKLYDKNHREFTDTAVIQRASGKSDGLDYAIKFFTSRAAYERERSMYADRDLRAALPPVTEIRSNEDGEVTAEGGFVFPPFIVTDRGESLDTWARNKRDPGFSATVRVLRDVAGQVKGLHAQGLVHRNLNPESILWRPKHQCWSLDDFGCADVSGTLLLRTLMFQHSSHPINQRS